MKNIILSLFFAGSQLLFSMESTTLSQEQRAADFNTVEISLDANPYEALAKKWGVDNKNQNHIKCEKLFARVDGLFEKALQDISVNENFDIDVFNKTIGDELSKVIARLKTI